MDEVFVKAYAKLTVHDFLLEVYFANWVAGMSEDEGRGVLNDLSERVRYRSRAPADAAADQDAAFQIQATAAEMMDEFAAKVRQRAADVRAQRTRIP